MARAFVLTEYKSRLGHFVPGFAMPFFATKRGQP
ncbi:hypothetical protein JOE21_002056 [Desmospora profundinema]|uniref:Uncharacterized protein n=1 Tax=Desmospora profundinema TaxID=1571184 RepID=A0ABU1IMP5_9BACL|nr:hypothetical protein [Desmospora profundinema]